MHTASARLLHQSLTSVSFMRSISNTSAFFDIADTNGDSNLISVSFLYSSSFE